MATPSRYRPIEGVSISQQHWQWRCDDYQVIADLMKYHEMPELLARIVAGRGYECDTAYDYLSPTLRALLPDPFHLLDMDKAVNRLVQAIKDGETLAVFGDYDVDGATSSALLIRYFRMLDKEMLYHIPDRREEGYGPNAPALLGLQQRGASVVMTVDCGAVAFAPLQEAAQAGLDVIVIDHHKGAAQLPEAVAVVNPNRLDEHSPCQHLAAVGVTFLVLVALNKRLREEGYFDNKSEPALLSLLDIVALGTICDVVPLTTVNRAFVTQGLKMLSHRTNTGLATLLEHAGIHGEITSYHAGFVMGPRINAGGRVGQADLGVRLLTGNDTATLKEIAGLLDMYNVERQTIEATVLQEAMEQAEHQHNQPMILVAGEGWHPGVIGIVASRLKDRFHCPAGVIALEGESGKASVRSVHGVDIGTAIVAAREAGVITEGGGHAMAGGFSLKSDALEDVQTFFNERLARDIQLYQETRTLKLDAAITTRMAHSGTIDVIQRAAPFGMGNATPYMVVKDASIVACDVLKDQHIRLVITDASGGKLKAMCFRAIGTALGDALLSCRREKMHIAGTLKEDIWQGRRQVTLIVQDIMLL